MSILDEILREKYAEVARKKASLFLDELKARALRVSTEQGFVRELTRTREPRIIAEIKRASPSKGVIRADLEPTKTACEYACAGACCLSILTDEKFFLGKLEHISLAKAALRRKNLPLLPILRKDFIVDPYQVWETRAAEADALLLIVAAVEDLGLKVLLEEALLASLDVLLEVHTERELETALDLLLAVPASSGCVALGINNRDLRSFDTDLAVTQRLAKHARTLLIQSPFAKMPLVSESGIFTAQDLSLLGSYGADAFLIGESLLGRGDPGENLKRLIEAVG